MRGLPLDKGLGVWDGAGMADSNKWTLKPGQEIKFLAGDWESGFEGYPHVHWIREDPHKGGCPFERLLDRPIEALRGTTDVGAREDEE